jgi:glycolate oxidase FAD binding subunit
LQHVIDQLAQTIRDAGARRQPLRIRGGGSKDFYGGELRGDVLDTRMYSGIVDYEPTELVITARAGTPLRDIEDTLRAQGQMLAFEPPYFGGDATLGGCVAAGLSGPRRAYAGSVRDLVLGIRMLDGVGRDLRFGGQVMKNVAGYDVSRLMTGSLGTLGVLLEVSLKTLPLPITETTLRREHNAADAIALMNTWAGTPLPITATCHVDDQLYVRLSGAESGVRAAHYKLGGEEVTDAVTFWQDVRDHRSACFRTDCALWRASAKPTAPPLAIHSPQLIEWSGALRWVATDLNASQVRDEAARAGGHATLFRGGDKRVGVMHPLTPALSAVHRRLKATFDPHSILNPGRMYPDF